MTDKLLLTKEYQEGLIKYVNRIHDRLYTNV
ncbi:hypothetical protein QFZ31_002244 [Neobacillus niacini]|nr:hypothetical protein [Neobacillus niacini]